ncbi:hypothetical protein GDO81_006841 [Engystomops pustulosus]|uniref:Pirin C-terminal domain-containing protein n=2 Tax=Engystomops pustulosus TaxID=76066 RepID=A0AAV7D1Y6_ENGPU|nr:hypothetical protein GDO81_006841 [Engystomops pustulosus]
MLNSGGPQQEATHAGYRTHDLSDSRQTLTLSDNAPWVSRQDRVRWTAFIYTLKGDIHVGPADAQKKIEAHHTAVLDDGDSVQFENKGDVLAHLVLIAGEPINEPVVQHGPFVMNTREEISKTIEDYTLYKNGFEKALTWKSKIGNR